MGSDMTMIPCCKANLNKEFCNIISKLSYYIEWNTHSLSKKVLFNVFYRYLIVRLSKMGNRANGVLFM